MPENQTFYHWHQAKRRMIMKIFNAYVQEANRLCKEMLSRNDSDSANKKLNCMQEKISRSRLNDYQKDSLIQQLRSTNEVLLLRKLWNEMTKGQDILY
jgi:hypothetical protein